MLLFLHMESLIFILRIININITQFKWHFLKKNIRSPSHVEQIVVHVLYEAS